MTLSLPIIFIIVVLLFLAGGTAAFLAFQRDANKQQKEQQK